MAEVKIPLDNREIEMVKDYAESRKNRTHWDYYGWLDEVHGILESLARVVTAPDFDEQVHDATRKHTLNTTEEG